MNRLGTGSDELDLVLGGGIPTGSLLIIAGAPGTGKTILAQQICFANATAERKAVYYTTWSEPHDKLLRHLSPFAFFDRDALGAAVEFVHLADLVGAAPGDALAPLAGEIVRKSFEERPAVVVIDSSKALHDVVEERGFRKAVYELASRIGHTDAVLIFVGEYTLGDIEDGPEFAVADGIVRLTNDAAGAVDRRWLRVLKMRGSRPLTGKHSFELNARGFDVFPRFEALRPKPTSTQAAGRMSVGVEALDPMLGGGLPVGDSTLVVGPSGVGKTVLALNFIASGMAAAEDCLYVSLQEDADQLVAKASSLGLSLTDGIASGLLQILHVPPVELNLDRIGALIQAQLETKPFRRVVIDSLSELEVAAPESERFPPYIWSLTGACRAAGATTLVTHESAALGPLPIPASDYSFLFENTLFLRYLERGSAMGRGLNILKMRNSDHAKELVGYEIAADGLRIIESD